MTSPFIDRSGLDEITARRRARQTEDPFAKLRRIRAMFDRAKAKAAAQAVLDETAAQPSAQLDPETLTPQMQGQADVDTGSRSGWRRLIPSPFILEKMQQFSEASAGTVMDLSLIHI